MVPLRAVAEVAEVHLVVPAAHLAVGPHHDLTDSERAAARAAAALFVALAGLGLTVRDAPHDAVAEVRVDLACEPRKKRRARAARDVLTVLVQPREDRVVVPARAKLRQHVQVVARPRAHKRRRVLEVPRTIARPELELQAADR